MMTARRSSEKGDHAVGKTVELITPAEPVLVRLSFNHDLHTVFC
jgi:hypothetical protein